jgi:hypothetical protein
MLTTKLQLTKTNCRSTLKTVLGDLFDIDKHTWFQIIETDDSFTIQQVDNNILDAICVQASQMKSKTGKKQLVVNIPRYLIKNRSFRLEPVVAWSVINNTLHGTVKKT